MGRSAWSGAVWAVGLLLTHGVFSVTVPGQGAERPLRNYLDLDLTRNKASGQAIHRGVVTALDEAAYRLAGRAVELRILDHRGRVSQSQRNLRRIQADPDAVALVAGMHSVPLLKSAAYMQRHGLLTLVPWAAAGPITRFSKQPNWVFRVSVDDAVAGQVIARHAVTTYGSKRPLLLLEDTGWGRSNERTMTEELRRLGIMPLPTRWFRWGISAAAARVLLKDIVAAGPDALLLVANYPEAKTLIKVHFELPRAQWLPFCSHWGLTGGDFAKVVPYGVRQACRLTFIQSKFSFIGQAPGSLGGRVFARVRRLFPAWQTPEHIQAPAGLIHAYDATLLLLAAGEQVGTGWRDARDLRGKLREALEQLRAPVRGLVKTYRQPFTAPGRGRDRAHEALTVGDYTMARYRADGVVELIPSSQPEARPGKSP